MSPFKSDYSVACVAWRFCRAGRQERRSHEKFAREARENDRRSRELPLQSPRGFSALARLYYLVRPTKTAKLRRLTIVCLVSFFIFAFGNERRIRESDRQKKNAGCGIFYKNLSSNRRSKSRMESDNLEEPLVFNYTIASSYHLGDLFLSFFLFFLQKTCFNGLHLQAVQRRLQEMRVRMAEDLCQRIVSAEAK